MLFLLRSELQLKRNKLTNREIRAAFDDAKIAERFPPIMTTEQIAELFQCSKSCVQKWSSEGKLDFAKSNHGPIRFWRDRVVAWSFGERGN